MTNINSYFMTSLDLRDSTVHGITNTYYDMFALGKIAMTKEILDHNESIRSDYRSYVGLKYLLAMTHILQLNNLTLEETKWDFFSSIPQGDLLNEMGLRDIIWLNVFNFDYDWSTEDVCFNKFIHQLTVSMYNRAYKDDGEFDFIEIEKAITDYMVETIGFEETKKLFDTLNYSISLPNTDKAASHNVMANYMMFMN